MKLINMNTLTMVIVFKFFIFVFQVKVFSAAVVILLIESVFLLHLFNFSSLILKPHLKTEVFVSTDLELFTMNFTV